MLSLNIFQLICSICTNDKYELRIRLNTNYSASLVCLGLICHIAENYSICNTWNKLILLQLVDFSSPSFTSCLQSCFLDPVEGGHRGVSPSQLFHLSSKISDQGIELPVIEPVSNMEEEEADKDEAESKNKQLLTRLRLDPDTFSKRDHPGDAEHYRQVVEQHGPLARLGALARVDTGRSIMHRPRQLSLLGGS